MAERGDKVRDRSSDVDSIRKESDWSDFLDSVEYERDPSNRFRGNLVRARTSSEFSYQTSKEGSTGGKRDRKSRRRRRERTNTIIKVLLCITARQRQQQHGRAKGRGERYRRQRKIKVHSSPGSDIRCSRFPRTRPARPHEFPSTRSFPESTLP